MSRYRLMITTCLALGAACPGAAATVFWPFGFHFPDRERHYAGGLSASAQPTPATTIAEGDGGFARGPQIALLADIPSDGADNVGDAGDAGTARSAIGDVPNGSYDLGN